MCDDYQRTKNNKKKEVEHHANQFIKSISLKIQCTCEAIKLFFVTDSKLKSFPSCLHASTCHMIHIFLMLSTQLLLNSNQRFGTAVVLTGQLFLYIVKSKLFTVSPNLGSTYSSVITPHPSLLTSHAPLTPHPLLLTTHPSPLSPLPLLLTLTPYFSCTLLTPHSSLLTPLPSLFTPLSSPLSAHPHTF